MYFAYRVVGQVSKKLEQAWCNYAIHSHPVSIILCELVHIWSVLLELLWKLFFLAASYLNGKSLPCIISQVFLRPNKEGNSEAKFYRH